MSDLAASPNVSVRWTGVQATARTWYPPARSTTIVVPHPDDEAILFGGLIGFLRDRAVPVHVIAVTDGEAAYDQTPPAPLAARRRREQEASLRTLGVEPADVRRLGVPDGAVDDHVAAVAEAIVERGDDVIIAPWRRDHHCDHEACGRAAELAGERLGVPVFGGLFWAWHHSTPTDLQGERLVRLPLDEELRTQRRGAIGEHRSQLGTEFGTPVLTEPLLDPTRWRDEFYVVCNTFAEAGGARRAR